MSTTLQSVIEEFTEEDQKFIQRRSSGLAAKMINHAESLAAGTAPPKTQEEVARKPAARAASKTKAKVSAKQTGTTHV